jgi:Ca2+-binding RTX toxin-like protein
MRVRRFAVVLGLGIGLGAAAVLLGASPAGAATSATLNGAGRLTVTGTPGGETIVVRALNSTTIRVTAPGINRNFAAGTVRSIQVNAAGGNDTVRIDDAVRAFTTTRPTVLDGGGGNDTIRGGRGGETLRGGNGDDTVTGLKGNDRVELGAGVDTAVWNQGQGNDQVDGGAGADTQRSVGTAGADAATLAPQAGRVRVGLGAAAIRTRFVETIDLRLGDGADTIVGSPLTGLGVVTVHAVLGGSGVADPDADTVVLRGTAAFDVAQAILNGSTVTVTGLGAQVLLDGAGVAQDRLTLEGGGGGDTFSGGVLSAAIRLTLDGGDGDDTLNGGNGADTLIGGAGIDTIDGNGGNDTALMGAGGDNFVWDPGDGSDVVEGQDGFDGLLFNGSPGMETFAASSNGGRLLFTRNVGNIVQDVDDVEALVVNALGGSDNVTVNSLASTDVTDVTVDLGVNGAGDASADAITVNGTSADDVFQLIGAGGVVSVRQPQFDVAIVNGELANDDLTLNGSGGDDGIFSAATGLNFFGYAFNGGSGDDVIIGTQVADTIDCGANTDYADGNAGVDSAVNCETVVGVP